MNWTDVKKSFFCKNLSKRPSWTTGGYSFTKLPVGSFCFYVFYLFLLVVSWFLIVFAVRTCLGARMAPKSPQALIFEAFLVNFGLFVAVFFW